MTITTSVLATTLPAPLPVPYVSPQGKTRGLAPREVYGNGDASVAADAFGRASCPRSVPV